MRHLFSPQGEAAIAAVMGRKPLLAFDFDGTLAPIVARPDDAQVAAGVAERLRRLAQRAPVAIVTGRSVADVTPRLGFEPQYLIGNHGAEDPQGPPLGHLGHLAPSSINALDALRLRLAEAAPRLQAAGVQVEDKQHSLALHYRQATDQDRALRRIEGLLNGLDPALRRFGGKCVVNIVAAASPDKGDAVHALVRRAGAQAAVFIGDDVNDEAVFIRAEAHWLTVRIGRDDAQSRAMFFLDDHDEIVPLLDRMLAQQRNATAA